MENIIIVVSKQQYMNVYNSWRKEFEEESASSGFLSRWLLATYGAIANVSIDRMTAEFLFIDKDDAMTFKLEYL